MAANIYLLLGLEDGATMAEIKRAYARLIASLDSTRQGDGESEPLARARRKLCESFQTLKDPEVRQAFPDRANAGQTGFEPDSPGAPAASFCRPKLGQLLVAAGLITLAELDAALEIQHNTGSAHVPLGELLVACGYIDRKTLDYYLAIQKVMKLPSDHPQRWGQRLIELGMVDEDQLKVALIEQKSTGCTLRQAIINRGFLTAAELDRIF